MTDFLRIEQILDENHDQEWDLWYLGPREEIASISRCFDDKKWTKFLDFTKSEKPDDWRVMLSHSYNEEYFGKSKSIVVFQVIKCKGHFESYAALQYLPDLNGVESWLVQALELKLVNMLKSATEQEKVLLSNMVALCKK